MASPIATHPRPPRGRGWFCRLHQSLLSALLITACGEVSAPQASNPEDPRPSRGCNVNENFLFASLSRDVTPSLDDPNWILAIDRTPDYLDPDTRIIGVFVSGRAWAIPHSVLWHHEIVNLDVGGAFGEQLAVTYCPLTGSSLVFDRSSVGGATLGVSGLLFKNNLVLYDRREPEDSLWPQMLGAAACGPRTGMQLTQYPFVEMQWAEWVALHPSTHVLAADQGFDPQQFDYTRGGYPYGLYRDIDGPFNNALPPIDRRLHAKERILGVPSTPEDPGIAFPFATLTEKDGSRQVVGFEYEGAQALVLWSDKAQGGAAFWPMTRDGAPVTLLATPSGFEDEETGSSWTVDGRAESGPMQGAQLEPLERAYTAFWFGWAAFHPETLLWED